MSQGHENFFAGLLEPAHRYLDLRRTTRVALLPQALKDLLRRVSLFLRSPPVLIQDLFDPIHEGPDLGFGTRLALPVARGLGMGQDLVQRPPMHPRLTQDLPFADVFTLDTIPNLCPLLHILVHPSTSENGLAYPPLRAYPPKPFSVGLSRVPHF